MTQEKYRTVTPQSNSQPIPLAHSLLSAGSAFALEDGYEQLDINNLITRGREGFLAFIVTGDSMVDTIQPGSIVVVDPMAEARNGSIVVAMVDDRVNVKIFEQRSTGLYLVPLNPKYKPQRIDRDFTVIGVVRGCISLF
jgi:DNA polymerase V